MTQPQPELIGPTAGALVRRVPSRRVVGLVALAWLLIGLGIGLLVSGSFLLAYLLDDWLPPLRVGPALVVALGGATLTATALGIAWVVVQVPNRRTLSISLVAAIVLLGLLLASRLPQGSISIQPDLILAGFAVVASALGVWQTR